jgi:histidyl-tRNA synthetase
MTRRKSKLRILQNPVGMRDMLPADFSIVNKIEETAKSIASFYGFEKIDTPILEETKLFSVKRPEGNYFSEKELFSFKTSDGEALTLRPDGVLPVARSYIQNNMSDLPQPLKLFFSGQFFRNEELRKGYQKMFHQLGLVMFGEESAVAEAEILHIIFLTLSELGFKNLFIHLNSIGCLDCRPSYRSQLSGYYRNKTKKLCKNCQRNFKRSPLKLLECADERCAIIKQNSPQALDYLCEICKDSFKELLEFFDEIGIPYILNPRLVGTFNYYSRTVFRIFHDSQEEGEAEKEKSLPLGSGGRFDSLIQSMGGKPTPAAAGIMGIERILHALRKIPDVKFETPQSRVFLVQLGDLSKRKSFSVLEKLRRAGISVQESLGKDSIKSQLKIAEKVGAEIALIIGQKEAIDGTIIVREVSSGSQETTPQEKLIDLLERKLKK